jgi:hypothetical protein
MIADLLTKPLEPGTFKRLRAKLLNEGQTGDIDESKGDDNALSNISGDRWMTVSFCLSDNVEELKGVLDGTKCSE